MGGTVQRSTPGKTVVAGTTSLPMRMEKDGEPPTAASPLSAPAGADNKEVRAFREGLRNG